MNIKYYTFIGLVTALVDWLENVHPKEHQKAKNELNDFLKNALLKEGRKIIKAANDDVGWLKAETAMQRVQVHKEVALNGALRELITQERRVPKPDDEARMVMERMADKIAERAAKAVKVVEKTPEYELHKAMMDRLANFRTALDVMIKQVADLDPTAKALCRLLFTTLERIGGGGPDDSSYANGLGNNSACACLCSSCTAGSCPSCSDPSCTSCPP